ncbi:ribosome maturation factor RimP [Desulfospira joergensenii]|uniref:ribosome maturation factor RimP n=1 Tax=Desulfospira joergensenii TaxID=53329 RepID=UPI00041A2CB1|nr:ribosome assembly cofactor RimP [Desulfospira joergensenii]
MAGRVAQVALPLCQAENYELVHVECFGRDREVIVRVFADKPGGITLEDCVYISRQLGDLIDVHIENMGSYRLEVSSPGPNRPLNKKEDFYRFAGRRVKIETREAIDGQRKFTGVLEKVNEDSVLVGVDGKKVEISDLQISKAILAGD